MRHILLGEDDPALGRGVALALAGAEVEVSLRECFASGAEAVAAGGWDLIILDVNLPDGSGLELLRKIRLRGGTPVILLTANDMEIDQMAGFKLDADDYVTKPFSLAVLRTRVNAQLRRAAPDAVYAAGDGKSVADAGYGHAGGIPAGAV